MDNVTLNAGSGGDTIAADDIGGVKHQQVKIEYGIDGVATPVSSGSPLPVTVYGTPTVAVSGSINSITSTVSAYITNGAGDGAILDGVSSSIKATVLDYANSNPIAVRLTDTSGDYVTASGGTQYTEGDSDTTISGTAMMFETNVASSLLGVVSSSNPLPISDNNTTISIDDGSGSITVDGSLTSITSTVSAYITNAAGLAAVHIQDGGNSITVDGTVGVSSVTNAVSATLLTGSNTIGNVGTVSTITNVVHVDDNSSSLTIDGSLSSITSTVSAYITNPSGLAAVNIQDGGNSITVDGTVGVSALTNAVSATLLTGTNSIGNIGTVSTITNVVHVDDNSSTLSIDDGGASITIDGSLSSITSTVSAYINNGSGGSAVNIQDGGNSITVDGTVAVSSITSTTSAYINNGAGASAVNIQDGGNSITVDGTVGVSSISAAVSATLLTGSNTIGSVKLTDGTDTADVLDLTNSNPLTVAIVDGSGDQITSFGGGTQYTEDAAAAADPVGTASILVRSDTPATITNANGDNVAQRGTNYGAGYVQVVTSSGAYVDTFGGGTQYTEGDTDTTITGTALIFETNVASSILGVVSSTNPLPISDNNATISVDDGAGSITVDGTVAVSSITSAVSAQLLAGTAAIGTVTASNTAGDVAHDGVDSGNPIKFGTKAASALPTAVTDGDRANAISDLNGRVLVSHIDPLMQIWKQVEYTTAQTGTAVWTPTSGKKIAITSFQITTGGTTAAVVTLWFGGAVDTTFTQGTDQVLFRGEFAPSSTQRPGVVMSLPVPIVSDTASNRLRITTSAAITIYVTVVGYEI